MQVQEGRIVPCRISIQVVPLVKPGMIVYWWEEEEGGREEGGGVA